MKANRKQRHKSVDINDKEALISQMLRKQERFLENYRMMQSRSSAVRKSSSSKRGTSAAKSNKGKIVISNLDETRDVTTFNLKQNATDLRRPKPNPKMEDEGPMDISSNEEGEVEFEINTSNVMLGNSFVHDISLDLQPSQTNDPNKNTG